MENAPPRGGMDKADQIAPVIAMLDRRNGALSVKAPDLLQDGLEADAVLIHRPQLDLRRGKGGRYGLDERPDLFLNCSCALGSALTCRGPGLRRLPSRRTRYAQPSCTLTGRPSRWLIQSATVRPIQTAPSGAGPRTTAASSASCSGKSGARCEWVGDWLTMPA